MPSFPSAAKVTVGADRVVKVSISRPRPYYARGGTVNLNELVTSVSVTFNTPLADANWVFAGLTIWNSADPEVDIVYMGVISRVAKSASGFTVSLSAPPPAGSSYKLDWSIAEAYDP